MSKEPVIVPGPPPDFQKRLWQNWIMWIGPLIGVVGGIWAQEWLAAVWAALCIVHVAVITQREIVIDLLWRYIDAKGWSEVTRHE